MQGEESFEDNRKKSATLWDAIISFNDLLKATVLEIIRSERWTLPGQINLLMAFFILLIFVIQSLKTVFDETIYMLLFLFAAFFLSSAMMAIKSFRLKQVGKLREKF